MVELDVVDLIGSSSLEPFINEVELSISYPQLLVVEDRSESCVRHEPTFALVLVLEEWFDQQSAVLHICSDSDHSGSQLFLLFRSKLHLGIKDRGCRIVRQGLSWLLL
jgi:hypothetical protein